MKISNNKLKLLINLLDNKENNYVKFIKKLVIKLINNLLIYLNYNFNKKWIKISN
jgi:hypothetical protein